jgi:Na+/melibiose symporter-like transporter
VVVNVGQALGQFLSLIALSWVGYRAAGETDPGALQSIRVLYALVPSLVMVLTLVMALRYRLTANRHARLREALARRKKLVRPAIQAEELAPRVGA